MPLEMAASSIIIYKSLTLLLLFSYLLPGEAAGPYYSHLTFFETNCLISFNSTWHLSSRLLLFSAFLFSSLAKALSLSPDHVRQMPTVRPSAVASHLGNALPRSPPRKGEKAVDLGMRNPTTRQGILRTSKQRLPLRQPRRQPLPYLLVHPLQRRQEHNSSLALALQTPIVHLHAVALRLGNALRQSPLRKGEKAVDSVMRSLMTLPDSD
jgi:hypothetical protein